MRFTYAILILALLSLTACSEARYVAHLAKQVALPTDTPESKGTFKVGNPYRIKGKRYFPKESYTHSETGIASWYGPNFHGKQTANGEIFDKFELTAAHRTLQMPSLVRVTNLENGKSLILRINDRGPFAHNRVIDVSQRASELLGFRKQGIAKVRVDVLGPESRQIAEAAKRGEDTRGYEVALNQNRVPARMRPAVKPEQPAVQTAQASSNRVVRPPQPKPIIEPVSFETAQVTRPVQAFQGQPLPPSQQRIFVQAGAFSQENNAMALARQLEPYGPSKVYLARVDNRPFYRVRLGPYETTQQADLALDTIISSGKSDAKIVID